MTLPEKIDRACARMKQMPHLAAIAELRDVFVPVLHDNAACAGRVPFRAGVFNMERCERLDLILPYLLHHPALCNLDILLANELDVGHARTGNRDTAAEAAEALGMHHIFATEFLSARAGRSGNGAGRHGNAIFSRFALSNAETLHLPIEYEWFDRPGDTRLGTRIAILADADVSGTPVGLVCVHLENRTTPQGRLRQAQYLLDAIEARFGSRPVLVGGDMNTSTVDGDDPHGMDRFLDDPAFARARLADVPVYEPLMDAFESRGFSWRDCNIANKSTRRKPMDDGRQILLNLDWLFARGLVCTAPERVETVFDHRALACAEADAYAHFDGQQLSDHDAVTVSCALRSDAEKPRNMQQ